MQWFQYQLRMFRIGLKQKLPALLVCGFLAVFLFLFLYNSIVYTVASGQAGVLYRRFSGGTVVDKVYSEGIHFLFPWNKMFIYNVRVQQVTHSFDVLTREGLKVRLNISIRFHPDYQLLGLLQKRVGPDYVNTIVIPDVESVLRVLVGQVNADELYVTRRATLEKTINEAVARVHRRYITVDAVIIKNVVLPKEVEKAIDKKIAEKELTEAQVYIVNRQKLEKQRKIIEAQGMSSYNRIVNASLTPAILQWEAIQASLKLAKSPNSKVVVVGSGKGGLPIFGNLSLTPSSKIETTASNAGKNDSAAAKTPAAPLPAKTDGKEETDSKVNKKTAPNPLASLLPSLKAAVAKIEPHANR